LFSKGYFLILAILLMMNVLLKNGLYCYFFLFMHVLLVCQVHAQQEAQFTYSTQSYNPAYVGFNEEKSIIALYRAQWIGVEGAPKTQVLHYGSPTKWKGLSIGFGLLNDKIGPTSETMANIDMSYTIFLSSDVKVAFGIKASAHLLDINLSLLNQDYNLGPDPVLNNSIDNRFSPNIGAGVFYYTPDYYIGLSVPSFLETLYFDQSSLSKAKEETHFYLNSGFVKEVTPDLLLRPSFLIKAVAGAPLQTDIAVAVLLKGKVSFGFSYRVRAAISGLFGYQFSDHFFTGISYDRAATDLGQEIFNSGSLELVLKYRFANSRSNIRFNF
jgi:type IX secretion system PorP/SprF family membrane protein